MTNPEIIEELRRHVSGGFFTITVKLAEVVYMCFLEGETLHTYRVERNLITYHAKEVSPDLDCDVVEDFCLQIEEQYAADSNNGGETSD